MASLDTSILPPFLAQVVYKTSVLHLQPRQMTVHLADLAFKRTMSPLSARSRRTTCACNRDATVASGSDSAFSNSSSLRDIAIVPADRDPLLQQLDDDGPPEDSIEEPLSLAEKMLFQSVLTEFSELRVAVEKHIARMKCFASDLERSSQRLDSLGTSTLTSASLTRGTSRIPVLTNLSKDDCLTYGVLRTQKIERAVVEPSTSSAFWFRQFDDIEYIDDDDSSLLRTSTERTPLIENTRTAETSRKGAKQLNDITSVLDKLSKLANDLTTRCAVGQLTNERSPRSVRYHGLYASGDACSDSSATVSSLRSQLKDISRRVSQIEKKISYGDELLDEVCGDLQQRIQHIKNVLGEQPANVEEVTTPFLTMNNKAPFWNEASQVYQLDFGGRVTQESAKNFQIEYNDRQVMQFGRIENGAYTLDFRGPFSAVQAFAVALASITQRLK